MLRRMILPRTASLTNVTTRPQISSAPALEPARVTEDNARLSSPRALAAASTYRYVHWHVGVQTRDSESGPVLYIRSSAQVVHVQYVFDTVYLCFFETGVIGGVSVLPTRSQSSAARLGGEALTQGKKPFALSHARYTMANDLTWNG